MPEINEIIKSADWKKEKHVPAIKLKGTPKKGEQIEVSVGVGKEVAHPNTTQHHIRWVSLFFLPEGEKIPIEIGDLTFSAHGSSTEGADTSTVYTHHGGTFIFKTEKPGTLLASSYCNIHGLWEGSAELKF